uniref:Lysozyme g n=1 Tax=Oncorhynchus tshawytscha TaxID=74940 RepID=A0A8C8IGN0_ONCTS
GPVGLRVGSKTDFMKVKSKYGDIMEVKTTGASKETADADGYSGVTASERMEEYDKDDIKKYIDIIRKVGKENEIAPALICGIISRETSGGRGDYGRGLLVHLRFSEISSKRSRESFLTRSGSSC